MQDDQYRLEDALSTFQATAQQLERFAMRAALKGGISGDTRRQMLAHLDTMRGAINKLPEVK